MALFNITHERYYNNSVNFTGDGTTVEFTITTAALDPIPVAKADIDIYVDGKEVASGYIDVQAGDIVIDGKSYPDVKAVLDEYLSAFAEQKAFEEKMFKLAGLK